MKTFTDLPNIEAVDYIVKKYSADKGDAKIQEAPADSVINEGRDSATRRPPYCPPCNYPPLPAPLPQPVANISFRALHTLSSTIDLINENIVIAYELSVRTSNRQAQYILRDFIAVAERDIAILRNIFFEATGINHTIRPNMPPAGFFNNVALKAMFVNQTQILENLQSLTEDITMRPYLPMLEYVLAGEISQLRRIAQLYDLRT